MTKAQEVKKALKGHFDNLRCVGGTGTASGWVTVSFDYPKPKDCYCGSIGRCSKCREAMREAEAKVYQLIKEAGVKLYTYLPDDNSNQDSECMQININLI